jgi:hypothetical protein
MVGGNIGRWLCWNRDLEIWKVVNGDLGSVSFWDRDFTVAVGMSVCVAISRQWILLCSTTTHADRSRARVVLRIDREPLSISTFVANEERTLEICHEAT